MGLVVIVALLLKSDYQTIFELQLLLLLLLFLVVSTDPEPSFSVHTILHLDNISFQWYLNNAALFQLSFRTFIANTVIGASFENIDISTVTQGSVIVTFEIGVPTSEKAEAVSTTLTSLITSGYSLTNLVNMLSEDSLENPSQPATIIAADSSATVAGNSSGQLSSVDLGLAVGIPLSVLFLGIVGNYLPHTHTHFSFSNPLVNSMCFFILFHQFRGSSFTAGSTIGRQTPSTLLLSSIPRLKASPSLTP